jgi:hypothetical protein
MERLLSLAIGSGEQVAYGDGGKCMSTGVEIIIAVIAAVAILAFAMLLLLPGRRVKRRERELTQRRERVAGQHREEAEIRTDRANAAEQQARVAAAEAQRERAEAELHEARANVHEQGLADHELISDGERHRFAGTSAVPDEETRTADREPMPARGDADVDSRERLPADQDRYADDRPSVRADRAQLAGDDGASLPAESGSRYR